MVLVVGELLIDMVTTEIVTDLSKAKTLEVKVGGSAANFASFCQKQGANVRFIASIGQDGFGDIAVHNLQQSSLTIDHINRLPHQFTSVIIVSKSHGTPEFIPYRDADNNIEPINDQLIEECDVIHTTAFALSKQPAQNNILAAFEKARKAKKLTSLDWNYAEKIWGANNTAHEVFNKVISYQPLLKISMDDAHRFWQFGNDIEQAKTILDKYKIDSICLTNGAGGVYYKTNGSWKHKPTLPTNVIDVTGAGDAFWSGFITSYIINGSVESAIDNALFMAKERLEQRI